MTTPARTLLLGVVLFAGVAASGPTPISLSSRFSFGTEPATFSVLVRMPHHPDNRVLCVGYDGPQFSESCGFVDGDSPAIREVRFRDVPAGVYVAFARLTRTTREHLATYPFEVLSRR